MAETPADDEQITEEGDGNEDSAGDNETPVTDPAEDPAEDSAEEPAEEPTEEVEEPAADPETPAESDEPEDDITLDSAEVNAPGDTYTVTIENYVVLKSQVDFSATVGGNPASISQKGVITAKEPEQGSNPSISLTITAKPNWEITEVKKDGADTGVTASNGTYTVTTDATAAVTVKTVATYNVKVTGEGGTGIKVKTSDDAEATPTDITVAGTTTKPAVLKKDRDLVFEVADSAAVEGTSRLKVYYIADGSDGDDPIEITPETTGTAPNTKTTYTVKKDIIDTLDESIEIKLVAEEKVAVTVDTDGSQVTDIEVEVPKTGSTTGETEWVAYAETTTPNNKVFSGETFKFRVKTAANYTIKKALLDDETELTAGAAMTVGTGESAVTWIPYEVTPQKAATVTFETEFDSTKKSTLTFTLTGNDRSATAKITGVSPVTIAGETATDAEIATALGIKEAQLTLEAGKSLDILKPTGDGATVEVTVTPTPGYALKKTSATEAIPATGRKYTFTGTTLTAELKVEAETEAAETEDARFFKITTSDADIKNITVDTAGGKVTKKGTDAAPFYEVAEGAQTVKFTVDVKEGNKLAAISQAYSAPTEVSTTNGFTKYEVLLQANKITSTVEANPTDIALTKTAITYTVSESEDNSETGYEASYSVKDNADEEATFDEYTLGEALGYNHALEAVIVPTANYSLAEVSYTMGGVSVPVTIEYDEDFDEEIAKLTIAKVTDDVEVTIKTKKDSLKLGKLEEVVVNSGSTSFKEVEDRDSDGIYQVNYNGKYVVDVLDAGLSVAAKDISVVVKDASGTAVAMTTPIVTPSTGTAKRSFNLAGKNLAGQEITAEVSYKGELVDTYIMQVNQKTTELSVNGGAAIEQVVDSVEYYPITTNGAMPSDLNIDVTNADGSKDLATLITATIEKDQLKVTIAPASHSQIATKTTTVSGENETTTWTPWTAIIKVEAPDDKDIYDEVEISLTPLFDEDAAPTVSLVDAANNVLNVKVDMADVAAPRTGSVWYEVTATANEGEAGEDGKRPTRPDDLYPSAKAIVKMSDGRVALTVSSKELGAETSAWEAGYDVTAKLVYVGTKSKPSSAAGAVAVSKEGKLEGATTKTPLFEDALKLKKAPGAPAKLYTGQTEDIVIAVPQWTKKFSSYQILDENVSDNVYYSRALDAGVNADGNIVVHGVPAQAQLGKHTITVMATADMTDGHTMYASRATITVNVVKGINKILVTQPSKSIYKDPKKAGTLKLGVDYNHDSVGQPDSDSSYASWNGKKDITAPATKKVKWSIVDAGSTLSNIKEAPAYLKVGDTKNGVNVKNGTVTVAKGFTRDERHSNNNMFRVLVEADDFAGNTTKALSETITITADALDISTLVIVNENEKGENVITAVHDIKDKKPVSVLASDVDGGYVYALPANASVAVGTKWTSRIANTVTHVENLTMTTTNKKVLMLGGDYEADNYITVLAAGKKAGIKVVTNDGGKKTHTMNLTLDYKETKGSDLALGISRRTVDDGFDDYYDYSSISIFDPENKSADAAKAGKANETPVEVKFNTTGAARLDVQLYVGEKADGTSTKYSTDDVWATNYKLAVKGGKAIYNANGYATIVTTAKETTLTLTDQTKEAKAAKKKAYVYKIVNEAYDNTKLAKAPKVTVKGSLYAYGTAEEQNKALQLTVLDAANKNAPFAKDKTVKVELDWSARTDKNEDMLNNFADELYLSSKGANTAVLGETGTISLFSGMVNKDQRISFSFWDYYSQTSKDGVGSYKLKVTVGKGEGDSFVAETLPATVTVKVVKNKVFTFKPTTTYTINKADGGAVLTGKANLNAKAGEMLYMNFGNLQNVNLKGKSNKFTHYFKIVPDEVTGTQRLYLNTEDDLVKAMIYEPEKNADGTDKMEDGKVVLSSTLKEDPVINIPKEDLTGYITYTAWPKVNYYTNNYAYGTVKITVKIAPEIKTGKTAKASQKYANEKAEIALEANKTTEMNVIVNGAYVSVAYALVDDTKSSSNAKQLELVNTGSGISAKLGTNDKGQIVLRTTEAVDEGKPYSTNLLIVPNSSFYKTAIDKAAAAVAAKEGEAAAAATKQDLIKKYGIAIKVSVLASKNPAPTPDPTAVGGGDEPGEDLPIPEDFKGSLKTAAETVKIANDAYEAPAAGSEDNATGTIKADMLEGIKTNITTAIAAVEGSADYTITVGDITVDTNPGEDVGAATATITVARAGYVTATIPITLVIEKAAESKPES